MEDDGQEAIQAAAPDVCPLVPVSGISMEKAVALARSLAERVGRELQISGAA